MSRFFVFIYLILTTFPLYCNEQNEKEKNDLSYNIYKNEINDVYEKCIHKFMTSYDDKYQSTAYGTVFLERMVHILNPKNILANYNDVMNDIEKLKQSCFAAQSGFNSKHKYQEYVYSPYYKKTSKSTQLFDDAHFDLSKFESTYKEIKTKVENRYDIKSVSNEDIQKYVKVNFSIPYRCIMKAKIGQSLGFFLGEQLSYGKVECVDSLGGVYKWKNTLLRGFVQGIIVSIDFANEYNFVMSKSSTTKEIYYIPRDKTTALFINEYDDGKNPTIAPGIGIGISELSQITIDFFGKKKFIKVDYEKIIPAPLKEILMGETLWERLKLAL